MKAGIVSILLALILALSPYLPVVAQETGTITITMTGVNEISITVSPASWGPGGGGAVRPNQEYETDPTQLQPAIYFTLTVAGNCNVKTSIVGGDAKCVEKPTYEWVLSSDGANAKAVYALWFRVSSEGSYETEYTLITKTQREFSPPHGRGSSLAPGEKVQFGLKLKTPSPDFTEGGVGYFSVGDATMETHITISAVAA